MILTPSSSTGSALLKPTALQSTLLVAGIHYAWAQGSLLSFQQSYLSNKIATIRAVNAALVDPWEWRKGEYARLITTLAMIEVCPPHEDAREGIVPRPHHCFAPFIRKALE